MNYPKKLAGAHCMLFTDPLFLFRVTGCTQTWIKALTNKMFFSLPVHRELPLRLILFFLGIKWLIDCSQLAWLPAALDPSPLFTLHTVPASLTFCQPFCCQCMSWHLMIFRRSNVTFITLYRLWQTQIQMQTWNADWIQSKQWYVFEWHLSRHVEIQVKNDLFPIIL